MNVGKVCWQDGLAIEFAGDIFYCIAIYQCGYVISHTGSINLATCDAKQQLHMYNLHWIKPPFPEPGTQKVTKYYFLHAQVIEKSFFSL